MTVKELAGHSRWYRARDLFRSPKLRVQVIHLVLLAVLPALGLIFYNARQEHRIAGALAERQSLRVARTALASYERLFDGSRQLLKMLARLAAVRLGDPSSCGSILGEMLREYTQYTNLAVATLDGDVICTALPVHRSINIADRSYFQRAIQDLDFSVGEYQVGRRTGKPTINFAYPVVGENGAPRLVVFAALDLAWLKRLGAASKIPEHSTLTVIDDRGTIVSGVPDPGSWIGKTLPEAEIVKIVLAQSEGATESVGLDGIPRFYGFATLNIGPQQGRFHLIVGIPTSVALADAKRNLARNLAGLFAVVLFSLAVAWWGGERFILRPIGVLLGTTEKLRLGDLDARSGLPHGANEIGRLATGFDKMAETLQENTVEMARAQQRLQQSLDRTRALHDADLAINSKLDLQATLKLLLEKVDLVLPEAATTVRLLDKESGQLDPIACRHLDKTLWRDGYRGMPQGFAKTVLENKIPLAVANIQTDRRMTSREFARKFGFVSFLGIPLVVKEEVLGLIAFYTRAEHSFSDEEIEFLSMLAGQLAIAIHNAKLYDGLKLREAEVSALHALTVAATQSLDVSKVLDEAIKKITEIFHFDVARVFLFNTDMTELDVKAAFETKPEYWLQATHFQRGESLVGRVAESGEAMIFTDIVADSRYHKLSSSQSALKAGSRFVAMLPITTRLKTWGVLVCGAGMPRTLQPAEIDLLSAMTNQVGIAVENATLYEQTATKAKELSALYAIAGVASESLEINLILRKTMEKVLQIFSFDAARVYLCKGENRDLHLVFDAGFPDGFVPPTCYQMGDGLVGTTVQGGEPLSIEDMDTDPNYVNLARNKTMFNAGFRASILIPIRVRGEGLGVMNFLCKKPHHYSDSDLQLIKAIAYHLAIAVGNANLFSQVNQKTIELETANRGKDEFLGVISHELRTPL
ncbi:MAG TPA: GAF domain-containing protein, partial [Terriglobales bacterium]|nr:GAF domain-containing protein [Terriglobales bacterium]